MRQHTKFTESPTVELSCASRRLSVGLSSGCPGLLAGPFVLTDHECSPRALPASLLAGPNRSPFNSGTVSEALTLPDTSAEFIKPNKLIREYKGQQTCRDKKQRGSEDTGRRELGFGAQTASHKETSTRSKPQKTKPTMEIGTLKVQRLLQLALLPQNT
jgi:hypothetical protein